MNEETKYHNPFLELPGNERAIVLAVIAIALLAIIILAIALMAGKDFMDDLRYVLHALASG